MFANTLLTSDQWHEYLNNADKYHVIIIDLPAGWNAHNFEYEWYKEKITKEEFLARRSRSAIRSERKADLKKKGITDYGQHF